MLLGPKVCMSVLEVAMVSNRTLTRDEGCRKRQYDTGCDAG